MLIRGVYPVAIMLLELILFKRYANGSNMLWRFGSQAAYTVYLIHPPFVALVTRSYLSTAGAVLTSSHGPNYGLFYYGHMPPGWAGTPYAASFPPGTYWLACASPAEQEVVAWLGLAYCWLATNLAVWPVAYLFKQLPGVRDVL